MCDIKHIVNISASLADLARLTGEPSRNVDMPKASRFSGHLQNGLPKIALRVRNRMHQLGLTEGELASRCNQIAQSMFAGDEQPRVSRERIAKILMNCKLNPEKSAARVLTYQELSVLSSALNVSFEWLLGTTGERDPILWDPLAEPTRAEQILHLVGEHEEKARELLVWAEYLLCPLVTPEFMHRNHEARFCELDILGLHKEKQKVVRLYDQIGNARRKRLLRAGAARSYSFTQLIFLSELGKIAGGTLEYQLIGKKLRQECLENLTQLVSDPTLKISLVIAEEDDIGNLKTALRDYDSISVFGEEFTLWGYHSGMIAWSEHPSHVLPFRQLLTQFQEKAKYRDREAVSRVLKDMSAKVN